MHEFQQAKNNITFNIELSLGNKFDKVRGREQQTHTKKRELY
jgi:hypothetical protein